MLLLPLASEPPTDFFDDEEVDVEGSDAGGATVELAAGFDLNLTAQDPLGKMMDITDRELLRANECYRIIWRRVKELCGLGHSTAQALSRIDLLSAKAAKAHDGKDNGWNNYRKVLLSLLNRPGGITEQLEDVMRARRVIPAERWMDARDENRRRVDGAVLDEYDVPLPPGGQYTSSIGLQDEVTKLIYSPEVLNHNGSERLHKKLHRSIKKSKELRASLDILIDDARKQSTLPDLQAALRKLDDWRQHLKLTVDMEDPEFTSRAEDVAELFLSFGATMELPSRAKPRGAKASGAKKRLAKASREAKITGVMPTESEVMEASEHWANYLRTIQDEQNCPVPTRTSCADRVELLEGSGDIGMENYDGKSDLEIWANLGLPGATQFPFAHPGDENRKPVRPMRHQLAGTASILSRVFTRPSESAAPTLLCDDVGLGKTYQILAAMKMIAHWRELQEKSPEKVLPLPPFAVENGATCFAGRAQIPNLPFLVVLPRTLSTQWLKEIPDFARRGSFCVVHYSTECGNISRFFSDPNGDYCKAAGAQGQHAGRVIVIADTSAISKEAARCFKPLSRRNSGAAQRRFAVGNIDVMEPRQEISLRGTIWDQWFTMVAYDESHDLRNSTILALSSERLSNNSLVRVASTATPIFTGPMVARRLTHRLIFLWEDVLSQGRILRHCSLLGRDGQATFDRIRKSKKNREKEWEEHAQALVAKAIRKEVRQSATDAGVRDDPAQLMEITAQVQRKYESEDQVKIIQSSYVNKPAIQLLRTIILPVVDPEGKPIVNIRPYKYCTVWSPLSEREQEILDRVNEVHEEQVQRRKRGEKFDVEILKWTVSNPEHLIFLLMTVVRNRSAELPSQPERRMLPLGDCDSQGRERAKEMKKESLCLRLADTWNADNIRENVDAHEQEKLQPDPPQLTKPRKFMIYVEYKVHRHLLKKVFAIQGRDFVEYHGEMTPTKRDAAVLKFTNNPNCRIMLISKVAGAGLNLTAANVVIFVSPVWSGQEKKQIIGRAWRLGQTEEVIVLDIHAPRGPDLALAGYAGSKCALSAQFLRSERKLYKAHQVWLAVERDVLREGDEDEDKDDSIEEDVPLAGIKQAKRSHVKPRQQKALDAEAPAAPLLGLRHDAQAASGGGPSRKRSAQPLSSRPATPGQSSGPRAMKAAAYETTTSDLPRKRSKIASSAVAQVGSATAAPSAPAEDAAMQASTSASKLESRAQHFGFQVEPCFLPPTAPQHSPLLFQTPVPLIVASSSPPPASSSPPPASSSPPPSPSPLPCPLQASSPPPLSSPVALRSASSALGPLIAPPAWRNSSSSDGAIAEAPILTVPLTAARSQPLVWSRGTNQPSGVCSSSRSVASDEEAPQSPVLTSPVVLLHVPPPLTEIPWAAAHPRPKPRPAPRSEPLSGTGDGSIDFFDLANRPAVLSKPIPLESPPAVARTPRTPHKHIPLVPAHLQPKPKPAPRPEPLTSPVHKSAVLVNAPTPLVPVPRPVSSKGLPARSASKGSGFGQGSSSAARIMAPLLPTAPQTTGGFALPTQSYRQFGNMGGSNKRPQSSAIFQAGRDKGQSGEGSSSAKVASTLAAVVVPKTSAYSGQQKRSGFAKRGVKPAGTQAAGGSRDAKATSLNMHDRELETASAGLRAAPQKHRTSMF
ncbi:Helicase conserved C-terminal domain [Ceratobasidium sp. AG-Ba]|nr:Helicase conserved C-terminal domain [Ceratobasidium sp. AG-Ba]